MENVEELFPKHLCKTKLWVSKRVKKEILNYAKKKDNPKGTLLGKLLRYCKEGFPLWTGDDLPIRAELGIYRIGHPKTQFRIYGFFEDHQQTEFIALDAFEKNGRLTPAEKARLKKRVMQVRDDKTWRKTNG